jgi:hypothetical protein
VPGAKPVSATYRPTTRPVVNFYVQSTNHGLGEPRQSSQFPKKKENHGDGCLAGDAQASRATKHVLNLLLELL